MQPFGADTITTLLSALRPAKPAKPVKSAWNIPSGFMGTVSQTQTLLKPNEHEMLHSAHLDL